MQRKKQRWAIGTLIPLLAPPILESAFMWRFYDINGYGGMIGVGLGLLAMAWIPLRLEFRLILMIAYLPIAGIILFLTGASLACGIYHSCL